MSDENDDKNKEAPRQRVALCQPEIMVKLVRILQAARHYVRQADTASNEDAIRALDRLRAVLDSLRAVLDDVPQFPLEFGKDESEEAFVAICASTSWPGLSRLNKRQGTACARGTVHRRMTPSGRWTTCAR